MGLNNKNVTPANIKSGKQKFSRFYLVIMKFVPTYILIIGIMILLLSAPVGAKKLKTREFKPETPINVVKINSTFDSRFNVAINIDASKYAGNRHLVKVTAHPGIIDQVLLKTHGSILSILPMFPLGDDYDIGITIFMANLIDLKSIGTNNVHVTGINAPSFTAFLKGTGKIVLSGAAEDASIQIAGKVRVEASDFAATVMEIYAGGYTRAVVRPVEHLHIVAKNASVVFYIRVAGSEIIIHSGSGRVKAIHSDNEAVF